jgi:hypothetical protein
MTYFDSFVVGSWMFAIGVVLWSHLRAEPEKTESPGVSEKPERRSDCESWRSPAVPSDSFDWRSISWPSCSSGWAGH